mmetsp:Transcript_46010/g.77359  ORF Transcript_46010/g.77359 Transcript_46010/m.77359 type:complete len:434 (-) Transcript_46010:346-1647(-)
MCGLNNASVPLQNLIYFSKLALKLLLPETLRLSHPHRSLLSIIGEDHISTSSAHGQQRLQCNLLFIDVACGCRCLDHCILPGHMIRSNRQRTVLLQDCNHIQVRQTRLDHQNICTLGLIKLNLPQSLTAVGRVHLICGLVAKRGIGVQCSAERSVERRGVLRSVGHDSHTGESLIVQCVSNGANPSILHIGRCHNVGSSSGLLHGLLAELLHGDIVDDLPSVHIHNAIVTVAVVGIQGNIGADNHVRMSSLDHFNSTHDNIVLVVALTTVRGLQLIRNLGEENEGSDTHCNVFCNFPHHRCSAEPVASGHGRDFLVKIIIMDKEGCNEICRCHGRFPHERPDDRGPSVPARPGHLLQLISFRDVMRVSRRAWRNPWDSSSLNILSCGCGHSPINRLQVHRHLLLVLVHEAVKHSHSSCDEASKAKEGHGFHVA